MPAKDKKVEFSVDLLKEVVKKFKNEGFNALTHFQLAIALTTIGFKEVCRQFGAKWTQQYSQQAVEILKKSQYDLSWYGRVNNLRFNEFLQLVVRGDIQKIKDFIRSLNKQSKQELILTVDNFKRNALHLAAKENFDILTEFLINEGFSIDARDRELKTPLHYCQSGLLCQLLLKKGAKVFVKDNKKCTPAHYAASLKESQVLQILLKHSNIVNEVDSTLKTPLFYATFNSCEEQVNMLRVLFQNGAKVNQTDMYGKTPLHYAAQLGKTRCIPFLLQKGASLDIRDKYNKAPLDLASNQKVKKILIAYTQNSGIVSQKQERQKRQTFEQISNRNSSKNHSQSKISKQNSQDSNVNAQIYTKQINQVSTWIREKFFVLMKKLQESGVKSYWHIKRPYIYTGSWAEDIDSLEDLYEAFANVNGPQAAMRAFNILCPYQKPLPKVIGKTEEAFQSFFGENWFSNDPVEKVRNMHSQNKIRAQYQAKVQECESLQRELTGYRGQIETHERQISTLRAQLKRYQKIEEQVHKQRRKNTQQYSLILQLTNEKEEFKQQIQNLLNGEEKSKILSQLLQKQKEKTQHLEKQIQQIKAREAAARRKCGKIFLKSLQKQNEIQNYFDGKDVEDDNLYDDDAIISLYDLLKNNPPNLEKRFIKADRRGKGQLNVQEFTSMLQQLSMLPQDVMSMHRITGFSQGRKTLSLSQLKTILQNRHKNRPMWQRKLIRKLKEIILSKNLSIDKFFDLIDKDGNGTIEANQLREGLENYNVFMNHKDWCNLFNLLDSDKSGQVDLGEFKALMENQRSGKLEREVQEQEDQKEESQQGEKQLEQGQEGEQQKNQEQQQKAKSQQAQEAKSQQAQEAKSQQAQKEPNQQQQQQASKQSYQSRQQIGRNILQHNPSQQQFSQSYQQSQISQQGEKINGQVRIQLPLVKLKLSEEQLEKMSNQCYARFIIDDQEQMKLVDLTQKKLAIAVKFKMIQYRILEREKFVAYVSLWKSRNVQDQDNYLGEVKLELAKLLDKPQQWAINGKFKLEAYEFEKQDIAGAVGLQAKWIPNQE